MSCKGCARAVSGAVTLHQPEGCRNGTGLMYQATSCPTSPWSCPWLQKQISGKSIMKGDVTSSANPPVSDCLWLGESQAPGLSECWVTLSGFLSCDHTGLPGKSRTSLCHPKLLCQTLYQTLADLSVLSLATPADAPIHLFIYFYLSVAVSCPLPVPQASPCFYPPLFEDEKS